jgi:hypothetical protein
MTAFALPQAVSQGGMPLAYMNERSKPHSTGRWRGNPILSPSEVRFLWRDNVPIDFPEVPLLDSKGKLKEKC